MHDFYAVGCRTTFVTAPRLDARVGAAVTLAAETFQRTGSFKFRAAHHLVSHVPHAEIITASSGNFGQALAYACRLAGKRCTVVMPRTSAAVKVEAVREYGGIVDLVDTNVVGRAERVAQLAAERPGAYVASAYDDPLVIAGNATLGRELAAAARDGRTFDAILVPIGGGGLSAGIVQGLRESGDATPVIGAEPLLGNDAAESLRQGRVVRNEREPPTLADGARTLSLGRHNWAILKDGLAGIVEISEARIADAVRLLYSLANLKVEPTGALTIGALLEQPERWRGQRVCCVASGGNVDPAAYASLLGRPDGAAP